MNHAKYYIYRNLRTGGFSIKHRGIVLKRRQELVAYDVTFKVNQKGRERVLKDRQKNVHAFVVCDKYDYKYYSPLDNMPVITYNPYLAANFVCDGEVIHSAKEVLFFEGKCYFVK